MLRWPLRFLTFSQAALAVSACIVLSSISFRSRFERDMLIAYAAIGMVVSLFVAPLEWKWHVIFFALVVLTTLTLVSARVEENARALLLGASLLTIHLCFHFQWTQNDNVGDWPVPTASRYPEPVPPVGDSRIVAMPLAFPCADGRCVFASGNIGMWEQGRTLNGYSPVGQRIYQERFGFNLWSWSSPALLASYFVTDPESGKRLYELMRISEARVTGSRLLARFDQLSAGMWQRQPVSGGAVFSREVSERFPGTVSWLSDGLAASESGDISTLSERVRLGRNRAGGRLVFARAWYPGYEASLNDRPLPVERHFGLLVSVVVPPGETGDVVLRFRPPGFAWTVPLALGAVGLAALVAVSEFVRARRFVR
jgi:hypothetical protein